MIAHAVLGSIAVLFLFPAGGLWIYLWRDSETGQGKRWAVRVHSALQMFAFLMYCATAALGLWMAIKFQIVRLEIREGNCADDDLDRRWQRLCPPQTLPSHHWTDPAGLSLRASFLATGERSY
jgi:hypothetical protein